MRLPHRTLLLALIAIPIVIKKRMGVRAIE